jgi:hypothetical protein
MCIQDVAQQQQQLTFDMATDNVSHSDKVPLWVERFENLCLALRRNDAAVTKVDFYTIDRIKSYGPSLGDALQGNTHVSSLDLYATNGHIVTEELDVSPVHVMPLLNFVRQSQSLRKMRFRVGHRPDYLPYFLEAVLENPLITDLILRTSDEYEVPLGIGPLIQSKLNLKVLHVPVVPGDLFHDALKTNLFIETLSLNFCRGSSHESDPILRSIGSHPRITRLALLSEEEVLIDGDALCNLLASTTVLECLEMECRIDYSLMERFVEGLHDNRTITELDIPLDYLCDQRQSHRCF